MIEVTALAQEKLGEYLSSNDVTPAIRVYLHEGG